MSYTYQYYTAQRNSELVITNLWGIFLLSRRVPCDTLSIENTSLGLDWETCIMREMNYVGPSFTEKIKDKDSSFLLLISSREKEEFQTKLLSTDKSSI